MKLFSLKCKKLILVISVMFCAKSGMISQSVHYLNHAKYWHYRTRLRNDFMVVGPNQGMSIPMQQRGLNYYPYTGSPINYSFNSIPYDQGVMAKWGDAMGDLGYYIGVLATEYEMLRLNDQNKDSTLKELYYALYAANRIDINGDRIFTSSIMGQNDPPIEPLTNTNNLALLNGFAIKDDVSKDFLAQHFFDLNYNINSGFVSKIKINDLYSEGDNSYTTSWSSAGSSHQASSSFISQDNYYNLLLGLTLVRKFVPDNEKYLVDNQVKFFQDGETGIGNEALKIAKRYLDYFKSDDFNLKFPNGDGIPTNDGGNAVGYSFGHYEAFCKMKNKSWGYHNPTEENGIAFHDACARYDWTHVNTGHWLHDKTTNLWRQGIGMVLRFSNYQVVKHRICDENDRSELVWDFSVGNFNNSNDKAVMLTNLLAIGANKYNFNSNYSGYWINDRAYSWNNSPVRNLYHGNLLRAVIHSYENCLQYGEANPFPSGELFFVLPELLQSAPCDGTYAYPPDLGPTIDYEWHTTSRLDWPDRRDEVSPFFPGEYNGLDYLLYHNLYYLVRKMQTNDVQNKVVDFSNRNITLTYPLNLPNTGSPAWGAINNPATIGAYENIISTSLINSNASVSMIAGKQIDLKPGFTVNSGASYTATIDRLDCSSIFNQNNQYMNVNGRTNGTSDSLFTYYESLPTSYSENQNDLENESVRSNEVVQYEPSNGTNDAFKELKLNGAINLFPNPTYDKIQLEIPTSGDVKEIIITNQLGQTVVSFNNNGIKTKMEISLANYPSGFYLARFINNNGMSVVKKIIKQ